jgi:hypothetical protein
MPSLSSLSVAPSNAELWAVAAARYRLSPVARARKWLALLQCPSCTHVRAALADPNIRCPDPAGVKRPRADSSGHTDDTEQVSRVAAKIHKDIHRTFPDELFMKSPVSVGQARDDGGGHLLKPLTDARTPLPGPERCA